MGPLPEMTNGDRGPFGADFVFSARARQSGYKHWVDCNPVAEGRHAATVVLDRKVYKRGSEGRIHNKKMDKQTAPQEPKTRTAEDSPKPLFLEKLPVFNSEEEARAALANRGKGPEGEGEEEGQRLRG